MAKKAKTMSVKCVGCEKCVKTNLADMLIKPFEDGTKETQQLFSYFLHLAPDIDSVHSKEIPRNRHSALLAEMMEGRHFENPRFCFAQARIETELSDGSIDGDSVCLKCKRFVCKRKQHKKNVKDETDFECFLRHIRNAIAHGRVHYLHAGNRIHILLEDVNPEGNMTARILCIKADLEHWKKILSNKNNYL